MEKQIDLREKSPGKETSGLKRPVKFLAGTIVCVLIIVCGVTGMAHLSSSKKPPVKKDPPNAMMTVSTIPALTEEVSLTVTGYGQASPVNIIDISPQVSGRVMEKHGALKEGGVIQKGEILFRIDAVDYEIAAEKAKIKVDLQTNQIAQLAISYKKDKDRLGSVKQNTTLAKAEYGRLKKLYQQNRVGTLSSVETAEQNYNSLLDTEKTLIKSIALYPLQIAEAKSNLADAESDLKSAQLDVDRCVVKAPFTGRVKSVSIETGTYISTGTQAVTLADDSTFEIEVSLSDKDAFEYLGLAGNDSNTESTENIEYKHSASLSGLDAVECRVETVTGNVTADLSATVHRAVKYDAESRTLYLAVRVSETHSFPLMDGMFCKVTFKGRSVGDAVKLSAASLNSDNTVYLSRNQVLKTLSVTKVLDDGDNVYVTGAFQTGDRIIVSHLVSPIENSPLKVAELENGNRLAANTNNIRTEIIDGEVDEVESSHSISGGPDKEGL